MNVYRFPLMLLAIHVGISSCLLGAEGNDPFVKIEPPALIGRWDLTVKDGEQVYPSWLEISLSGYRTLVGRYVGQFGSARPIAKIQFDAKAGAFAFSLPPQWEKRTSDILFEGRLQDEGLVGMTTNDAGQPVSWTAVRAPALGDQPEGKVRWGKRIRLFNGKDLTNWGVRHPDLPNGWVVQDGHLINERPGNDLVSIQSFGDFKLNVEFVYPDGSNSGLYLRGRHEIQIEDNYGMSPDSHLIGGVYGFLTPHLNAARKAGEWQEMEITLIGQQLTLKFNGVEIISKQNIPGITGGALDSREGQPGPLMIQGDHGPIRFRKVDLTPAR